MYKGETKTGFKFEVPKEALDNMELVDAIAELEENPLMVSKVTKLLLGTDQRKKLYDHVRAEDGRVPSEDLSQEIAEIFDAIGDPAKN